MSRYADLSPVAQDVLKIIQPHSSMRPISQGDIVAKTRTIAPNNIIYVALQELNNARLVTSMRHTVGDVTQNVYWPTGLHPITAPTLEEIRMASEPKNSQLAALIVTHGPISGSDLAAKAQDKGLNCPTKNVQGILGGHLTRGEIIMKKRDGLNWYMTPNQAEAWDGKPEGQADIDPPNQAAAHVMSAPPASAKQSKDEIPVNESDKGMPPSDRVLLEQANRALTQNLEQALAYNRISNDLIADLEQAMGVEHRDDLLEAAATMKTQIHGLRNDVCAANLIFSQLAETLKVEKPEEIPDALDELTHALATRAMLTEPADRGELMLILIDSSELVEFEELDQKDAAHAQQRAIQTIEQGHAARALVVRVMGEAKRHVEWKEAA